MSLHTADAIVLRRYPFRETSVTLTCLTDRFGKLKGLVKGLRAQPNRHHSAMEPFTINRIVFYDTRTSPLHLISQCDLLAALPELQRDLETMRVAAFCVELVDAVVPLEEPQPAVYQLLKEALERLTFAGQDLLSARVHFIARLLRLAGFQPQLNDCTSCGSAVHASGSASTPLGICPEQGEAESRGFWSARHGGLLCPSCLHEDPTAEPATDELLSALDMLSEAAQPVRVDPPWAALLGRRLDEFLRWRLDRPLKTMTHARS